MTKYLIWYSGGCTDIDEIVSPLRAAGDEVAVLLVQDGVFMADKGCRHAQRLVQAGVKLYVSRPHMESRGLSSRLGVPVTLVDYDQIVDLIMEQYDKVISM